MQEDYVVVARAIWSENEINKRELKIYLLPSMDGREKMKSGGGKEEGEKAGKGNRVGEGEEERDEEKEMQVSIINFNKFNRNVKIDTQKRFDKNYQ